MPPSANHRHTISRRTGQIILTQKARDWKRDAALNVRSQIGLMAVLSGLVKVTLTVHPRRNKDGSGSQVVQDRDNVCKAALDALNGLVYLDDRQIDPLIVTKGDPKEGGGITIWVESGE